MEFIPLTKYSKNVKGKQKNFEGKNKKLKKNENITGEKEDKTLTSKVKQKKFPKPRGSPLKDKKKKKPGFVKKKVGFKDIKNEDEDENDDDDDNDNDNDEVENENSDDDNEVSEMEIEEEGEVEKDENKEEDEDEDERREQAKLEKWKRLDEKKRNRLFIKLPKKIYSDSQIKELHPDIKSVIFPRKKKSRWCWALFVSEEKADQALQKLLKNKEVFVTKPKPNELVDKRREEKLKAVKRKKEIQKKRTEMWL